MTSRPTPRRTEPGQESVWDYPRPPRLETEPRRLVVTFAGKVVADTSKALRILETSHPPTYYLPPGDIDLTFLQPAAGSSFCEWKGNARYFDVTAAGRTAREGAWSYPAPAAPYDAVAYHVAFYCALMDRCLVGDEVATPQPGGFYGGWVTSWVVGPFKGEPGTAGW